METFSALPACRGGGGGGGIHWWAASAPSFDVFYDLCWINGWVSNREAGDLRRHRTHIDVIVMLGMFYKYMKSTDVEYVYICILFLNDGYLIFVHFTLYKFLLFPPMFSLSPLDICRWYALDMISHQISLDSEAIPYETSVAVRNIGIHWRLKTGPEVRVTKSIFTIYLIRFSIELKQKKPPRFYRCKFQVHLIEK